jgi:hypothetical protein
LGDKVDNFKMCKAVFYADARNPELKEKIFLLYRKNSSLNSFQDETLKEHNLFFDSYDVDDNHIMYCFNLPLGYENNYYCFVDGKYSEMDDVYKQHILKFHQRYYNIERVKGVLYRSEKLYKEWEEYLKTDIPRTQEIGSIPNWDIECFDISVLQENKNNTWNE